MTDAAKPAVLVTAAFLAPEAVAILEQAGYAVPCTSAYPSEAEAKQVANIEAGTHDASWVDATLRRLNCEGVE